MFQIGKSNTTRIPRRGCSPFGRHLIRRLPGLGPGEQRDVSGRERTSQGRGPAPAWQPPGGGGSAGGGMQPQAEPEALGNPLNSRTALRLTASTWPKEMDIGPRGECSSRVQGLRASLKIRNLEHFKVPVHLAKPKSALRMETSKFLASVLRGNSIL